MTRAADLIEVKAIPNGDSFSALIGGKILCSMSSGGCHRFRTELQAEVFGKSYRLGNTAGSFLSADVENFVTSSGATKIETRQATMRHTATLEVELAYNRAKSLAGVNLANAVDELASAWNAMSGDALRDELRKLVTAHKVHLNGAHTARVNAGVNGVDRKVFADEI